jgi:ribosomal protein S27AE
MMPNTRRETTDRRCRQTGVQLPSGTTIRLERIECSQCGKLVVMFGCVLLSGCLAIEAMCPRCNTKTLTTREVA